MLTVALDSVPGAPRGQPGPHRGSPGTVASSWRGSEWPELRLGGGFKSSQSLFPASPLQGERERREGF